MNEFKKKISELWRDYKKLWIAAIKQSKEEGKGLNLSHVMLGEPDLQHKLDTEVILLEERLKVSKKGGFFK